MRWRWRACTCGRGRRRIAGLLPAAYLDALKPEDRASRYTFDRLDGPRTVVAIEDGAVLGFVTTRGDELAAINVDPSAWARGVGKALIAEARAAIAANGCAEAQLWMLIGNERAHHFYLRDGWRSDGARRTETVWGVEVEEVQYRRRLGSP